MASGTPLRKRELSASTLWSYKHHRRGTFVIHPQGSQHPIASTPVIPAANPAHTAAGLRRPPASLAFRHRLAASSAVAPLTSPTVAIPEQLASRPDRLRNPSLRRCLQPGPTLASPGFSPAIMAGNHCLRANGRTVARVSVSACCGVIRGYKPKGCMHARRAQAGSKETVSAVTPVQGCLQASSPRCNANPSVPRGHRISASRAVRQRCNATPRHCHANTSPLPRTPFTLQGEFVSTCTALHGHCNANPSVPPANPWALQRHPSGAPTQPLGTATPTRRHFHTTSSAVRRDFMRGATR
jgi:hypothetical protein